MAAIQVNMRVPEVLLARINAAGGGDRTKWILEACRMRLDAGGRARASDVKTENAGGDHIKVTHHAGQQTPDPSSKPNMASLREICEGKMPLDADPGQCFSCGAILPLDTDSICCKRCDAGEPPPSCIVCENPMREVKGKWACADVSCGKYGVEQKPR